MKDLEGFKERYALNSRVVKKDGKLVEEVYRVGGRYDKEIRLDRRAPRGGSPLRDPDDEGGDQRAGAVLPDR